MKSEISDILRQTQALLVDSGIRWAVCGGFALELYLGAPIRTHGDLDLSVPEDDRERARLLMMQKGWRVYEFQGQGMLRPLREDMPSEPGRNLMCVKDGCELVTFWPCDEPGMVLHEWHPIGMKTFNYMEFLFHERTEDEFLLSHGARRTLDRAIMQREGIPFLAPEVVLLYKAAEPMREANLRDFEAAYPALEEERRRWFLQTLQAQYPDGHPWLNRT